MFISCGKEQETPLAVITPSEDKLLWLATDLPVSIVISKNFNENEERTILESIDKWEEAAGLDLISDFELIEPQSYTTLKEYYEEDSVNGIYRPTQKIEGLNHNVIAICQSYLSPYKEVKGVKYFKIEEADIILNDYYHDFIDDDDVSIDKNDKTTHHTSSIILHEFGHFFGLFHEESGIMNAGTEANEVIDEIDQITANAIFENYHDKELSSSTSQSKNFIIEKRTNISNNIISYQIILLSK